MKLENSVKYNSDLCHIFITGREMLTMKKIEVLPRTKTGNWAGMVSVAFIFLFPSKVLFALPMVSLAIFGVGIAGFVLGIVAVFIKKDHALFTYLSLLTGVLSIIWIVADMMSPQ
jgi:hypothetical protein